MIGRLIGILVEKQAPNLLVEVNGIGYELQAPMSTFYQLPDIGKKVSLYTHLLVREDNQSLYGFASRRERDLFRTLIKISGVGPRLGLAILSGMGANTFSQCILDNDVSSLMRLPGIGKRTAERLLLELRDKVTPGKTTENPAINDAITALLALGYNSQEANRAVAKYKDQSLSSEELIRRALKNIR